MEATAAALRQGVRLAQDAANGTKFDAQQQVCSDILTLQQDGPY